MNNLETKTVKELRDIAKELEITGRWNMTKQQLIEAITVSQFSDKDITFETGCCDGAQQIVEKKTTLDKLNEAEPGTLIAFKRRKDESLAMSGKLVSVDNEKGKVYIMSKLGTVFEIKKENVLWVKTSKYWPKWVHSLFNNKDKKGE